MYDLIIIGAGASGAAASLAANNLGLKTLVVTKTVFKASSPEDLGLLNPETLEKNFEVLYQTQDMVEVKANSEVLTLEKQIVSFAVEQKSGKVDYAKNVLIATGNNPVVFETLTQKTISGKIKVNSEMKTSVNGIWAVGAACDEQEKPLLVCVGEGVKAVWDIWQLKNKKP